MCGFVECGIIQYLILQAHRKKEEKEALDHNNFYLSVLKQIPTQRRLVDSSYDSEAA